jgi:hypothetical protein
MSVSVIVQRLPADFQGADISDPLIATEAQAVERGRMEIERNCSDRVMVSGTCPLQTYMQPGKIIHVTDLQLGEYRAMLRSFALTIDRQADGSFTAVTNIVMEREA